MAKVLRLTVARRRMWEKDDPMWIKEQVEIRADCFGWWEKHEKQGNFKILSVETLY